MNYKNKLERLREAILMIGYLLYILASKIAEVVLCIALCTLFVWYIVIPVVDFVLPIDGIQDLIIQTINQLHTSKS